MLMAKRKTGPREPNGRLQRPTVDRLNELNKAEALANTATVRAQPHRRGSDRRECVTALGRLWLSLNTDNRTLLNAGEEYLGLVRRWRAAWGAMNGERPMEGAGTGQGPSAATVRAWRRQIDQIERELGGLGRDRAILRAVKALVIDDIDQIGRARGNALVGLRVLAVGFQLLSPKDHPFR